MMVCANTMMLEKHPREVQEGEKVYNNVVKEAEPIFRDISEMIKNAREIYKSQNLEDCFDVDLEEWL